MSAAILCEQVELIENTINRDAREVEVVLIRPGWSANGRYYGPDVLAKAAALYENSRAFANHPTAEQVRKGESRDVRDLSGRYYNIRVGEAGELRGVRKVYDNPTGNAVWPLIVDATESRQPVIGLSINAVGKTSTGKGPDGKEGMIVEEITAVHSVDDVINPAAGGGFERLVADSNDLALEVVNAMTYEEFIAARPDYIETIREQQKRVRQDEAVRAALKERDQAQAELVEARTRIEELEAAQAAHRAELEQQEREAALDAAVTESKLPESWHKDLRKRLSERVSAEWGDIIQAEKEKFAALTERQPVPVSGAPALVNTAVTLTESPRPAENEDVGTWMKRVKRH